MTIQYRYSGTDNDFPRAASVITQVQSNIASNAGALAGLTFSVTLPSVVAGHLLIVSLRYGGTLGTTTTSCSDGTTTFQALTEKAVNGSGGGTAQTRLFYLLSSNASAGTATFTVTFGGIRSDVVLSVWDLSTTNAGFVFDVEAGSTGTSAAPSSGSFAITGANEVVAAQLGTVLNPGTGVSPSSPLINGVPPDSFKTAGLGDEAWKKVFLGAFTGAATATLNASDSWALVAAGFKADVPSIISPYEEHNIGDLLLQPRPIAPVRDFPGWPAEAMDPHPGQPSIGEGSDGWIGDIVFRRWPIAPSQPMPWEADPAELPEQRCVDDGGGVPIFSIGAPGSVTVGPADWSDDPIPPLAANAEGGDGNIGDIVFQRWPVPPSQIPPWVGEQDEWPTPTTPNATDDGTDILALLRAPVVPPILASPWADQDDLPLSITLDEDLWLAPILTPGVGGVITIRPDWWANDEIIPAVQPSAPPTEDWDPFRIMGLPVAPVPPSRGPDFWTLDEVIGTPPVDEEWYDLPLRFVQVPGPQRPAEWSWINDLVPTQPSVPATDEPGTLDWLLRVAAPIYTIFDRFVWDLDQDVPILVPVVQEVVDSPTRLLVLNYQSTVLYVLDDNGIPMAQPLIITAGEAGPLTLACAGANGDRQSLSDTTVTFRLVNVNATVYANAVTLTVVNAAEGVVRWDRLPAQVQDAGDYRMQVKVTFTDGTFKYFPDANLSLGNPLAILAAV